MAAPIHLCKVSTRRSELAARRDELLNFGTKSTLNVEFPERDVDAINHRLVDASKVDVALRVIAPGI